MMFDQISKDYIQAMKDRDRLKSDTLNFLRAQLKNVMIDKRIETLEDVDVVAILKKQVKQRQDSITQYGEGGRADLVEKESAELAILKTYLPKEMTEEQIKVIVREVIGEMGAQSMKDMGPVMKAVGVKTSGCADNRLVSALVKKALMAS